MAALSSLHSFLPCHFSIFPFFCHFTPCNCSGSLRPLLLNVNRTHGRDPLGARDYTTSEWRLRLHPIVVPQNAAVGSSSRHWRPLQTVGSVIAPILEEFVFIYASRKTQIASLLLPSRKNSSKSCDRLLTMADNRPIQPRIVEGTILITSLHQKGETGSKTRNGLV